MRQTKYLFNHSRNITQLTSFGPVDGIHPTLDTLHLNTNNLIKTFRESKWTEMKSTHDKIQHLISYKKNSMSLLNDLYYLHNYEVNMNGMDESERSTRLKLESFDEELDSILKRQFKIAHH